MTTIERKTLWIPKIDALAAIAVALRAEGKLAKDEIVVNYDSTCEEMNGNTVAGLTLAIRPAIPADADQGKGAE